MKQESILLSNLESTERAWVFIVQFLILPQRLVLDNTNPSEPESAAKIIHSIRDGIEMAQLPDPLLQV
jgi:hypothetical protein